MSIRGGGFKIDPTLAYSPEKKGKLKVAVRYFKENFIKTIEDERDIDVLNKMVDRSRRRPSFDTSNVPSARGNARRASYCGSYGDVRSKTILRKGLNLEPLPPSTDSVSGWP